MTVEDGPPAIDSQFLVCFQLVDLTPWFQVDLDSVGASVAESYGDVLIRQSRHSF